MSKPKRPKRRRNRRSGNIIIDQAYDPFPKSGLVKQYEPFIRKEVTKYCRQYPSLFRQCWTISRGYGFTESALRNLVYWLKPRRLPMYGFVSKSSRVIIAS